MQGGFFSGKNPLEVGGFPLLQLENRYIGVKPKKRKCKYGCEWTSLVGLVRIERNQSSCALESPVEGHRSLMVASTWVLRSREASTLISL